ncbi:hypothetical protein PS1_023360 [Malus domestica]
MEVRYVWWAVGNVVRFNKPACLCGEMPEHLVDVASGKEAVAAVLAQAVEDFGGDGPPLPLPYLGLLFLALTPPTPTQFCRMELVSIGRSGWERSTQVGLDGSDGSWDLHSLPVFLFLHDMTT